MTPITSSTVIAASIGTVLTPGTVTATGIDWSPTYEPDFTCVASLGALSSGGTVVCHVQGSAALSSGYASIGSATFNDAAGGTTIQVIDITAPVAVHRYYRSLITCVGGTAVGGISSNFIGKARTITD